MTTWLSSDGFWMLFNSYVFLFGFLPATWVGFQLLVQAGQRDAALSWLVAASILFYGWWNPLYVPLLLGSILGNFALGNWLAARAGRRDRLTRAALALGLSANLGLLIYFKYTDFLIGNLNALAGQPLLALQGIILPLGISFFTFQKLAYLVDAYRGLTERSSLRDYALFVLFFPQLIAGPIVHHATILPQFADSRIFRNWPENLAVGMTLFCMGLFKKVVIADSLAGYASPVFGGAEQGLDLSMAEAWMGALAYTFQLYFDFSGYSDMAIGAARTFGIRLPINFDSPYKATSITDFWRRWHITLSAFLRAYLYIPLGGNRRGPARRYVNLMLTMMLGGFWHGASWNFLLWGALHGAYLCLNHAWHLLADRVPAGVRLPRPVAVGASWALTFLAVTIAWVFFRATSLEGAFTLLSAMACGSELFATDADGLGSSVTSLGLAWVAAAAAIAWLAPNTQEITARYRPGLGLARARLGSRRFWQWRPTPAWVAGIAVLALVSIAMLERPSEFIYFQF